MVDIMDKVPVISGALTFSGEYSNPNWREDIHTLLQSKGYNTTIPNDSVMVFKDIQKGGIYDLEKRGWYVKDSSGDVEFMEDKYPADMPTKIL